MIGGCSAVAVFFGSVGANRIQGAERNSLHRALREPPPNSDGGPQSIGRLNLLGCRDTREQCVLIQGACEGMGDSSIEQKSSKCSSQTQRGPLAPSPGALSLSLSHTHTHTHTYTQIGAQQAASQAIARTAQLESQVSTLQHEAEKLQEAVGDPGDHIVGGVAQHDVLLSSILLLLVLVPLVPLLLNPSLVFRVCISPDLSRQVVRLGRRG
eukprot:1160309-Pelagomonas_calceolata.AAC.2